jgi:hypothetical protein
VILRCTRKLLAVLGAGQVADPAPDGEDWYANLLWIDRRKCLLLTHAATLFSVFEPDVRATRLRDTHNVVTALIERELQRRVDAALGACRTDLRIMWRPLLVIRVSQLVSRAAGHR